MAGIPIFGWPPCRRQPYGVPLLLDHFVDAPGRPHADLDGVRLQLLVLGLLGQILVDPRIAQGRKGTGFSGNPVVAAALIRQEIRRSDRSPNSPV